MYDISDFLGGKLKVMQPQSGYRAGADAVFVAASIALKKDQCLLDMGCGVGTIALLVGARFPSHPIVGIDVQEPLTDLATQNAALNHLKNLSFYTHDLLQEKPLPQLGWGRFDQVVTNPPYYDGDAHTASPDSTRAKARTATIPIQKWVAIGAKFLKGRGKLTLIYPANGLGELIQALGQNGFGGITLFPLWPKKGAPSKRLMVSAIKGSKTPFSLLQGMILHEESGAYTSAAEDVLRHGKEISF